MRYVIMYMTFVILTCVALVWEVTRYRKLRNSDAGWTADSLMFLALGSFIFPFGWFILYTLNRMNRQLTRGQYRGAG